MQSRIYQAVWKVLDVLFPPTCAGCGTWGKKFCPDCHQKTKLVHKPFCQICGEPQQRLDQVICSRCASTDMAFAAVRSWAYFQDPLKSAIHQLKYQRDIGLGSVLAGPLIDLLRQYHWQVDIILPIPLDAAREKQRGYNQAALLARPIAWMAGKKYSSDVLYRIRPTRQQVGLNREERVLNLQGAFQADMNKVAEKNILLVDDVITTGSTMNACAKALMDAGANSVYGLTLARSVHLY